jgi:hypothetical protein
MEHKQNADQRIASCNRRTTALWARSGNRHQWGDLCPKIIRKEFLGHASKLMATWLLGLLIGRPDDEGKPDINGAEQLGLIVEKTSAPRQNSLY